MNKKTGQLLSRREFAQRAAVLSATASLVSPEMILPAPPPADAAQTQAGPKLTVEGQAEADSRYQQILTLYGARLDEEQKTNIKRMCAELQPVLERVRSYKLENGDAPALYLKPLVEREKKPQAPAKSQPASSSKKPG
jgi:hypothetical protein